MTIVPDGATQRHSRLLDLMTYINTQRGATTVQIQSYMLTTYGLKFKTTSDMLLELNQAGIIKCDSGGVWRLTEKQTTALKRLQLQEEKENMIAPLLKKIDSIQDKKTKAKALKLLNRLFEMLPSEKANK